MILDVDEDDEGGADCVGNGGCVAGRGGGGGGGGAIGGGPSTAVDSLEAEAAVFVGVELGVDVVDRRYGSARRYK